MNLAILIFCLAVCLPVSIFSLQCLLALFGRRKSREGEPSVPRPDSSTVVLIPAHDEEAVIGDTLSTLLPTLSPQDRVLVVADNCSDRTAELAAAAGAEVIQRHDPERRGKGFALNHGVQHLSSNPPDVVVILDADCVVTATTVCELAKTAMDHQQPVQGLNLTDRQLPRSSREAVAILGNRVTNYVRPLGSSVVGMPCRLMGTGMAIPWPLLSKARLASDNLVEDLQLGLDLARQGHSTRFCPQARVTSSLPSGAKAFNTQRQRWEHGHLLTAIREVPRLMATGLRRMRVDLIWLALDLSVPPMALLVAGWLCSLIVAMMNWFAAGWWLPVAISICAGSALLISLLMSWVVHCRRQVPWTALVCIPFFLMSKLPIYLRFLVGRQKRWVRTERSAT